MSETREDYERFKRDYPAIYERLLEVNRALSALQRSVGKLAKQSGTPVQPGPQLSDDLTLELD